MSVDIYDVSSGKPILGQIAPEEVTPAVASGQYSLPKGKIIPVVAPDGSPGTIDASEAPQAFQNGYKYQEPGNQNIDYESPSQRAITGIEGVAKGALGPVAPLLEQELQVQPGQSMFPIAEQRARAEANPWTSGLGEAAGLLLPGMGSVMSGAGQAATAGLGLGAEGAGFASNVAGHAVNAGVQMAILQSGNELSKFIEQDPNQSAETALADIGIAGLLGAGTGTLFGATSPLWKVASESKAAQFIEDFKGQIKKRLENPNPAESLTSELGNYYSNISSVADEVYGATGLKAREIKALMPEMSEQITAQSQNLNDRIGSKLLELQDDPLVGKLQKPFEKWQEAVTRPSATSEDIFNATQELKQYTQEFSRYNKEIHPIAERDFRNTSKDISSTLRQALEDPDIWGKAAERQQAINSAFSKYLPTLQDFEKKFTTKLASGDRIIDPGKVNTFVNQYGKPTSEIKQGMLDNFMKESENYRKVIEDTHKNLGIESPFLSDSKATIDEFLEKKSAGAKVADALVNRGLAKTSGKAMGAGTGAIAGATVGHPGIGALIGEHVLGPIFESVLPGVVKPILEKAANGQGFKNMINLGSSIIRGDNVLNKGAKNLFKSGLQVSLKQDQKEDKKINKLKEKISDLQQNPDKLTSLGGQTGYYMPDHNAALASSAMRAVNYLSSLKPNNQKLGILDKPRIPSQVEVSKYNRALGIANNPVSVMDHIKAGTITPDDVMTLRSIAPNLYDRMSEKIMSEMTNHLNKGEEIPYQTRLGLSMFMAQPLDSTMSGQAIAMNQSIAAPAAQAQTQQKPQGRGPHSYKALNKMPAQFQTVDQARSLQKVEKSMS